MNQKKIRYFSDMANREWDKIKDSYIVSKKINLRERTKNIIEVKFMLDNLGVSFFLVHGGLLGAYRDGEFIKLDNDIDLDVFDEIFKRKYKEMREKFIEAGFIVRSTKIEQNRLGGKLNLYRFREKISIRSIYLNPNYEQGQYRLTNNFRYLKKFYNNPSSIKFKNEVFQTPGPIEKYLTYVYGDKWREPMTKNKLFKKWRGMEVRRSSEKIKKKR